MKEYEVTIYEKIAHTVVVSAEDKDAAYDKASDIVSSGVGFDTEYVGFMDLWEAEEL